MKLSDLANKECSLYLDKVCFHTGKPCHVDKKKCEIFEAWIIPLDGKYEKEINLYVSKYLGDKSD